MAVGAMSCSPGRGDIVHTKILQIPMAAGAASSQSSVADGGDTKKP
jgi:hypothetical protein